VAELTSTLNMRLVEASFIGAEVILVTWLLSTEDLGPIGVLFIAAVVAVALVSALARSWRLGATSVLIISSTMARFKGTLFSLHVRPEHVAIGLVVLVVFFHMARGQIKAITTLKADYLLMGYILLNFITSAVTSPEPRMTLRWAIMNAIVIAPYFLLRLLIKSEDFFHKAFDIMLWIGAAESAYGIFCFLSNRIFETQFGMEINQYGIIPGTYGTQYEPNLFGSYSACCAIMFLTLFLLGERSRWHGCGFLITSLGAAISLSRAVILAFPAVVLVVVWVAFKRRRFRVRRFVPLASAIALLLLIFSPFLLGLLRERFSTIDVNDISSDDTTAGRIVQMLVAVENVQAHPLLGTGTASFQLLFNWKDYQGEDLGGWVGNTPLRILHDTGVIGLTVFLLFVGSLLLAARRIIRDSSPGTGIALIALQSGLLLYAITFQSSEASLLAFTWVHFGLLSAAVATAKPCHSVVADA
jgi:O-antigen ligase